MWFFANQINEKKERRMELSDETKTNNANKKKILVNPKGTESIYETMQFSQAVRVGNMVWVSGQVGMDETFQIGQGIGDSALWRNTRAREGDSILRLFDFLGYGFDDIHA